MSVRVVARVRPLLKTERETDVVVRSGRPTATTSSNDALAATQSLNKKTKKLPEAKGNSTTAASRDNTVWIPNPKNESEDYGFQFSSVYGADAGQQELFDAEVAPTIKHLFGGFDVTLFAYGVTGTGKTHTMRGGKALADRGVIPRLLSGIFRRSRKIDKDTQGATKVGVSMSYYEIYNDKIFDLFDPPEKRSSSGLPLRESAGKSVVVGLSERSCTSLKEFESLYDQANVNRSTSATKLNSHSSRSHAILCVKLTVTTGESTRVSTVSAIDLAGSEDNRRTDNGKDRMVESASINKSLFVLAQCVEAMTKKQHRIPYRESKMTRILSLGQNNGLTVMILNLAPVRSYHLDTLSSLNFANRTKKVEAKEVENQPFLKAQPKAATGPSSTTGQSMKRQPLRPLAASVNANIGAAATANPEDTKPAKAFAVYTDKIQKRAQHGSGPRKSDQSKRSSLKRASEGLSTSHSRPSKASRVADTSSMNGISATKIEEMVQRKVEEILASRPQPTESHLNQQDALLTQSRELNEQVQRRLESLEQRIEGKEDSRAEGLSYLLMGKQHQARGEDSSALKMYLLAQPFFPDNEKLASKVGQLEEKLGKGSRPEVFGIPEHRTPARRRQKKGKARPLREHDSESEYEGWNDGASDDDQDYRTLAKVPAARSNVSKSLVGRRIIDSIDDQENHSPRTTHILSVINSRNVGNIKLLRGIGARKAESIVDCLCEMDDGQNNIPDAQPSQVRSLSELGRLKGVGMRTVENMRNGIEA